MRFCNFIDKYNRLFGYRNFKGIQKVPIQDKGRVTWYRTSFDIYMNTVVEASKVKYYGMDSAFFNMGHLPEKARPSFKILDRLSMDLYGAKIQEMYL